MKTPLTNEQREKVLSKVRAAAAAIAFSVEGGHASGLRITRALEDLAEAQELLEGVAQLEFPVDVPCMRTGSPGYSEKESAGLEQAQT
jgi:hypothetical protein